MFQTKNYFGWAVMMMLFINSLLVTPTRDGFLIDINDAHDTLSTSQLIRRLSHSSVPCRAIFGMTTFTRRDVIRFFWHHFLLTPTTAVTFSRLMRHVVRL